jgi:hypothetical protein
MNTRLDHVGIPFFTFDWNRDTWPIYTRQLHLPQKSNSIINFFLFIFIASVTDNNILVLYLH